MKNERNVREVRIINAKTGEETSALVPAHGRQPESPQLASEPDSTPPTPTRASEVVDASPSTAEPKTEQKSAENQAPPASPVPSERQGDGPRSEGTQEKKDGKSKVEIRTLEQFITHAYGRKGQRVRLTDKVQKQISQSTQLDEAAMHRLSALVDADEALAVPRQLLLATRDGVCLQNVRSAIAAFVLAVMDRHPVFAGAGLQGVLRNLPDAPTPRQALERIARFEPQVGNGAKPPKPAALQELRHNAVNLLVTWLACNRGFSLEDLAVLLFQSVWAPASRALEDDAARLRALTEVGQDAGVGLACEKFRQRATEATESRERTEREAESLREQVQGLNQNLEVTRSERDALVEELHALRERTAAEHAELLKSHEVDLTLSRHDREQLRGRLVRRIEESIEMLEVGLRALQNKVPRTEVMLERAELVIDQLRAEAAALSND